LMVIGALGFFIYEEYNFRKSLRACWNKFNILCGLNLIGLLLFISCYMWSLFVWVFDDMFEQYQASTVLYTVGLDMVLATFVLYTFSRSDALLWGNKKRVVLKYMVYFVVFLCCIDPLMIIGLASFRTVAIYSAQILSALILICLDVFYTTIFTRHVIESKSVFRSASNDKDVIAHYGRLSNIFNIACFVTYLIQYALELGVGTPTKVNQSLNSVSKLFLVGTSLMMVAMKYKLNKLSIQRSLNATTQQLTKTNQQSRSQAANATTLKSQAARDLESGSDSQIGSGSDVGSNTNSQTSDTSMIQNKNRL
jgi:hypothetical protein